MALAIERRCVQCGANVAPDRKELCNHCGRPFLGDKPITEFRYVGGKEPQLRSKFEAARADLESRGLFLIDTELRSELLGKALVARYGRRTRSVFRGVSEADCYAQAAHDGAIARSRGYEIESQAWADDGNVKVLSVVYRSALTDAREGVRSATTLASVMGFRPAGPLETPPAIAPAGQRRESAAHQLLNWLVGLWTFGYLAVIVLPIMSSNGNGAIGAVVGFGAAAVLFVPWLIGLIILVVLRSTTRSR